MDEEYFTISRGDPGGTPETRVHLAGEFDLGACPALREALFGIVDDDRPRGITVDLADVTFLDSEAINVLLDGYLAADEAGITYRLINPSGLVKRVFEVIDMPRLFGPES
ncbi:STAS domain-containing protein [Actinoplanes sp. NPDC051494]|uniref:STAS domain-containing protein n=1 Tax=Actinoplanes sp. NPDC051494 TaxID=3363907 RepID=UPI003797DA37